MLAGGLLAGVLLAFPEETRARVLAAEAVAEGAPPPTADRAERPGALSVLAPAQATTVRAAIADHAALTAAGLTATARFKSRETPVLTFYPHAGRPHEDAPFSSLFDHDPGDGFQDFACGTYSYDGHDGSDTSILGWKRQDAGVPIFAALPGEVVNTRDGEPDRNTTWEGQPSNMVLLAHDNGLYTFYAHLRNGSVAVSEGDVVAAGTPLGMIASSGNSRGPHLHFEVLEREEDGSLRPMDPFAGPCGAAQSLFMDPVAVHDQPVKALDFAISLEDPNHYDFTADTPTVRGVPVGDATRMWWLVYVRNLPMEGTWQLTVLRPDGTTRWQSDRRDYSLSPQRFALAYRWWMELGFSTPGTYQLQIDFNGEVIVEAPLLVHDGPHPENSPPAPVTLGWDKAPVPGDVAIAGVTGAGYLDDPDFDLVAHTWTWKVNGATMRQVTTAAPTDVLATDHFSEGDAVVVTCQPTDGTLTAAMATLEATVGVTPTDLWSATTALGDGWRESSWYGVFNTALAPWINHVHHGFQWIDPQQAATSVYVYDPVAGWWWTTAASYPAVYLFGHGGWYWYEEGTTNPRLFINLNDGTVKEF